MTGSWTVEPGSISSSVGSPSPGRAGRRARERDVLVERRVLVARRGLDRGDDLARDAQLGEVAEARLAVGAVVAHRLVEADEALLDEVVGVAAGEEVRRGLQADEAVVAADDPVVRVGAALLGQRDQDTHHQPEVELESRRRVEPRAVPSRAAVHGRTYRSSWRVTSPGAAPVAIEHASLTLDVQPEAQARS